MSCAILNSYHPISYVAITLVLRFWMYDEVPGWRRSWTKLMQVYNFCEKWIKHHWNLRVFGKTRICCHASTKNCSLKLHSHLIRNFVFSMLEQHKTIHLIKVKLISMYKCHIICILHSGCGRTRVYKQSVTWVSRSTVSVNVICNKFIERHIRWFFCRENLIGVKGFLFISFLHTFVITLQT